MTFAIQTAYYAPNVRYDMNHVVVMNAITCLLDSVNANEQMTLIFYLLR
jgi:hypothetical protein